MKTRSPEPAPAMLAVRLTPRASSNAVMRYADRVLFLRLSVPPVEGAANVACCQFVAKLLSVLPSQVSVKSGHKSRDKALAIVGMTQEAVNAFFAISTEGETPS